jgi:hypothetical protein
LWNAPCIDQEDVHDDMSSSLLETMVEEDTGGF